MLIGEKINPISLRKLSMPIESMFDSERAIINSYWHTFKKLVNNISISRVKVF
jgi:hypothetical protein